MRLLHPIIVKCKKCNVLLNVTIDLECVSSCERSMGEEFEFEGIMEDKCPNCGNDIHLNLSVWEYPVGAVNYQEEECYGGVIVEGPEYDPFENDDFY